MKVSVKGLGDVGMITDVDAPVLPDNGWTLLDNVRCIHGRIEPVDGYADITAWSNVGTREVYAHTLQPIETNVAYYIAYPYDDDGDGQAEAIYVYDGTATPVDITRSAGASPYTGTASDLWTSAFYNGLILLNNGKDCPQYWDGDVANDCVNLPWTLAGSDTWDNTDGGAVDGSDEYHAKVIRSFKNFLFALDITETIGGTTAYYPQMVHWSSIADPGNLPSWDYSDATEESGRVSLTETAGRVLDALSLGEQLVLYKEDAIYLCAFTGGQFVFQVRVQSTSHGLWASNCAVDIGGRHVCLGDGVVYTFDGATPTNILEGKLADEFFSKIDSDNYKKVFLTHSKEYSEVWICFPEIGETWANKALVWSYRTNTWFYRSIPKSSKIVAGVVNETTASDAWDDGTETTLAWDSETTLAWEGRTYSPVGDILIAASDQLIKFGQNSTTDAVQVVRTNIIVEDPTSWYMTRAMYPVGTGESFQIAIGGQTYIDGPVYWEPAQTFTPGTTRKLDWRTTYPIKAIQVNCDSGNAWTFDSYMIDHVKSGER